MTTTRDNAMTAGAELLVENATDYGQKCGLTKETAATQMLERALAIAWTDILMFQGANPSMDRLQECVRAMTERVTVEMAAQNILRRGHNADYGKKRH